MVKRGDGMSGSQSDPDPPAEDDDAKGIPQLLRPAPPSPGTDGSALLPSPTPGTEGPDHDPPPAPTPWPGLLPGAGTWKPPTPSGIDDAGTPGGGDGDHEEPHPRPPMDPSPPSGPMGAGGACRNDPGMDEDNDGDSDADIDGTIP